MTHIETLNQILQQATDNNPIYPTIDGKGQLWWWVLEDANLNGVYMHQLAARKRLVEALYLITALYSDYITDKIKKRIDKAADVWVDKYYNPNVRQPHWAVVVRDMYQLVATHRLHSQCADSHFDWSDQVRVVG